MAPINRRRLLGSVAAVGAVAPVSMLAPGCADDETYRGRDRVADPWPGKQTGTTRNPYEFGASGDGANDDTSALAATYEAVLAQGGGTIEITRGRYYLPGHFDMDQPGVSIVSSGGAVIGGGEVRIGPPEYDKRASGVDFTGTRVSGIAFDQDDDHGAARCLVLRNVRGLDISQNSFRSARLGIAVEGVDGNDKVHTTAMLRVSDNRFARLVFGVYGDTEEWDTLSDWHITDNYFNFCSDTAVWIACSDGENLGGVDGLNFAGNTIFSMNHNSREDPLFASKRYNLRLGKSNWLRIVNNNFFEAGLSAVYLDEPKHFAFVGNHIAWPGQRELGDGLEIHGGAPTGVIEGSTFALWTRAAIGLYDMSDMTHIEVGQNAMNWTPSPNSWSGTGSLPGYRVYASSGSNGYPVIRDFQVTGAHDELGGQTRRQSRDVKTPKGGVTGAIRRSLDVKTRTTVFRLSDITNSPNFGGLMSVTATSISDDALIATYLLFVSSEGSICTVVESGGHTDGAGPDHPSFAWTLINGELQAAPVGSTAGTYDFDAVGIGAVSPY